MSDAVALDPTGVGLAHLVLAMLWGTHALAPLVFDDPLVLLPDRDAPGNADAAAAWLASLPKPVWVIATSHSESAIALTSASVPASPQSGTAPELPAWQLDFLLATARASGNSPALIIAGGRPFRVTQSSLERLEAEYWLTPLIAMAGGPMDDPWVHSLWLPSEWLASIGCVIATGQQRAQSASMPLRGPEGWRACTVRSV